MNRAGAEDGGAGPAEHVIRGPMIQRAEGDEVAVYRLFNDAGELLYVGISKDPVSRWNGHRTSKPWWPEVASFEVVWCRSRVFAAYEERRALRRESPKHNLVGTPSWGWYVASHTQKAKLIEAFFSGFRQS